MKTIGIANQKGGVGKTTTTIEIAACLSKYHKKRVLVIDFDQQTNASMYADVDTSIPGMYSVLNGDVRIEEAIQKTSEFDIIRASQELSLVNDVFREAGDEFMLKEIVKIIENTNKYDYVLIDNTPARDRSLSMTYCASDYLIIPTLLDDGAIAGIGNVVADLKKLRNAYIPLAHAEILAIILTQYRDYNMDKVAKNTLMTNNSEIQLDKKGTICKPLIETIRYSNKASETKTFRCSLQSSLKSNNVAVDYRKLTKKLLERIGDK